MKKSKRNRNDRMRSLDIFHFRAYKFYKYLACFLAITLTFTTFGQSFNGRAFVRAIEIGQEESPKEVTENNGLENSEENGNQGESSEEPEGFVETESSPEIESESLTEEYQESGSEEQFEGETAEGTTEGTTEPDDEEELGVAESETEINKIDEAGATEEISGAEVDPEAENESEVESGIETNISENSDVTEDNSEEESELEGLTGAENESETELESEKETDLESVETEEPSELTETEEESEAESAEEKSEVESETDTESEQVSPSKEESNPAKDEKTESGLQNNPPKTETPVISDKELKELDSNNTSAAVRVIRTIRAEGENNVYVTGSFPADATVTAKKLNLDLESVQGFEEKGGEQFDLLAAYDIVLYDAQGNVIQPDGEVVISTEDPEVQNAKRNGQDVSAFYIPDEYIPAEVNMIPRDASLDAQKNVNSDQIEQMEIAEDPNENEDVFAFVTEHFSVYVVVSAKEPFVAGDIRLVQDLNELAENYDDVNGFYLSYSNMYFASTLNSKNCFNEVSSVDKAARWYFEKISGQDNQYYIYTLIDGTRQYMQNTSGNLVGLTDQLSLAMKLEISSADTAKFYLKTVVGENKWIQHSGSGGGIRLWTDNNNDTNSRISFSYCSSVFPPRDYYGLDGKTYSIVYHQEQVDGWGMDSTFYSNNNNLKSVPLLVRPNVLGADGLLLISQDSDLPDWKFTCIDSNQYYITTLIGGATYYLTLSSNSENVSLLSEPTVNSVFEVHSGSGTYSGKYSFKVGNRYLGLKSNGNYFISNNAANSWSWLNLAQKSTQLTDDDFLVYSAEKVDLSNEEEVPGGAKVVVYTRIWNEQTLKYEFYAVNYDGSLVRCYESGSLIQWVGSAINTLEWDFTEYTGSDGKPTYYYELKNTYPGGASSNCLRPSNNGSVIRNSVTNPDYSERSININGRRYGYFYSTILAWDDENYGYLGLKVKDDKSGVEVCPMNDADSFYFAVMTPTPGNNDSEFNEVETIDHEKYGITVKIQDHPTRKSMSDVIGSNEESKTSTPVKGLLSNHLDEETGYPITLGNNSLGELYEDANTVNHLFIKNTYFSSGYYEFDSAQNFATFWHNDGNGNLVRDDSYFTVYSQLATYDQTDKESLKHGQFFPYNYIVPGQFASVNGQNLYDALKVELPDSNPRKGELLYMLQGPNGTGGMGSNNPDCFYAMEIEAKFTQTVSGLDAWGHDIIYEFTGDDDFWLYVDGELIIDIGGVHSAIAGSVNYRTGEVIVSGESSTLREIFENNYRSRNNIPNRQSATDAQNAEVDDFLAQYFEEGETVFKDYTDHAMKIFYMERGAGAANLHMRFNLASVKPGTVELKKEISGVDSMESFVADYPFQIFFREKPTEVNPFPEEQQLVPGSNNISVQFKDTTRNVPFQTEFHAADGVTYENVYLLRPGEIAVIDFPDNSFDYRIVECYLNQNVYDRVLINNSEVVTDVDHNDQNNYWVSVAGSEHRADYSSSYEEVARRGRMTFTNEVDSSAKGTLVFLKRLYEEDGTTLIPHEASDTTFTFRLYLGTEYESDEDLPLANMHSYHVKDERDNYCKWVASVGFVSLGKSDFNALTEAEKKAATFTTSMNGSISDIPVDYSVEIREVPAGTKYKVEERDYELPDGYTLQWYVPYKEDPSTGMIYADLDEKTKVPYSDLILNGRVSKVEIRNLKGYGLRVYKTWSDAQWMSERDPIYLAVYHLVPEDPSVTPELLPETVKIMRYDENSAYWFFEHISPHPFDHYEVREVEIKDSAGQVVTPEVDASGFVKNPTNYQIIPIPVDGTGMFIVVGRQIEATNTDDYTYKFIKYEKGELPEGSNVRVDKLLNKRQGVDLYLTDWEGNPLSGGTFTLTDGYGKPAGEGNFVSDADGLITIAYLRADEDYTLTQISAPSGYQGLHAPIIISRHDEDITVTGGDNWFEKDDTNVEQGEKISYGTVTVKNKSFDIRIKKTIGGSNGEGLDGVTFQLYRQVVDGNGNIRRDYWPVEVWYNQGTEMLSYKYDQLVTSGGGFVPRIKDDFKSGMLLPGTYYLYEFQALAGYSSLSGDVVFTVDEMGNVTLEPETAALNVVRQSEETTEGHLDYMIVVPNEMYGTTEVTVKKTVVSGLVSDLDGTNRFNYTAKLYRYDGTTPWSYNDNGFTNGTISFNLGNGGSKLLEVPTGAVLLVSEIENTYYTTEASFGPTNESDTTISTGTISGEGRICTAKIKDAVPTTIEFTNTRKTVNVTVQKYVTGGSGAFRFKFTDIELVNGWILKTSPNIVVDANGEAIFSLSPANGKTVSVVLSIPIATPITISELDGDDQTKVKINSGNDVTVTSASLSATQTKNNNTVLFKNVISNRKLTITKTVVGVSAEQQNDDYTFTLVSVEGQGAEKTFAWTKNGEAQTPLVQGGTFTMKHDDVVVLTLPNGKLVTLQEGSGEYTTSWSATIGSGDSTEVTASGNNGAIELTLTADTSLSVVNAFSSAIVAPTGANFPVIPFLALLVMGMIFAPIAVIWRKRRGECLAQT